jgi:hypothetical protein
MGMLLKPLLAFCQAILRPFNLDYKTLAGARERKQNATNCDGKSDLEPMVSRPAKSGQGSTALSAVDDEAP